MAVADISEYPVLARDNRGSVIATGVEPSDAHQQLTIGVEVKSAAFGGNTRFVRVHAESAIRIKFGPTPTASATSPRMAAGSTEYFGVTPGHQISVIAG